MKNIKQIGIFIAIVVVVLACVFMVWRLRSSTTTSSVSRAALARLQTDLQQVTPHFVDAEQAVDRQSPTPQERKIKDDVIALLLAGQPDNGEFFSGLWLDAVGARYVLATQPIAESSYDEVIDSQTGTVTPIPESARYDLAPNRNAMLYIDEQHIYLYTLDQPAPTLVPGSTLSGSETYTSGEADVPSIIPRMSYTSDSITITIFDASNRVPNLKLGTEATMNGAAREVTLSF